jgi:predicted enzyme related to lactoylglutathione lyase
VEDCEASTALISELGGKVVSGPLSASAAIYSLVADPDGAVFCILEPVEPTWSKWIENPLVA